MSCCIVCRLSSYLLRRLSYVLRCVSKNVTTLIVNNFYRPEPILIISGTSKRGALSLRHTLLTDLMPHHSHNDLFWRAMTKAGIPMLTERPDSVCTAAVETRTQGLGQVVSGGQLIPVKFWADVRNCIIRLFLCCLNRYIYHLSYSYIATRFQAVGWKSTYHVTW